MRLFLSLFIVCFLCLRCLQGCQVLIEMDSNQQWGFVKSQFLELRGGQGYLAAPEEKGGRVGLLDDRKGVGMRTKWVSIPYHGFVWCS